MATWKKVIVSGSNAELNTLFTSAHITSSGIISASGKLFGGLDLDESIEQVIVYDTSNGELKYKTLNLVSTQRAGELRLFEWVDNDITTQPFKLSFDSGSSSDNVTAGIGIFEPLSASDDGGSTYNGYDGTTADYLKGQNDTISDINTNTDAEEFYNPPTNNTGSIEDTRLAYIAGAIGTRTFNFQSVDNTNSAYPAYFDGANMNYGPRAFDRGGIGELRIFVNTNNPASPTRTFDLSSDVGAVNDTANNITVTLFATQSNVGDGGAEDPTKHHRSGSISILAGAQRDGYNYAFVIHTGSDNGTQFSYITNYAEWFYDVEGSAIAIASSSNDNVKVATEAVFNASDTASISGIKFYTDTAADDSYFKYHFEGTNVYRNIYKHSGGVRFFSNSSTTIGHLSVTQSGTYVNGPDYQGVADAGLAESFNTAPLNNVTDAPTSDLKVTASIGVTFNSINDSFYQSQSWSVSSAGFYPNISASDSTFTPWQQSNEIYWTAHLDHVTGHKSTLSFPEVNYNSYLINFLTEYSNEYEFETFRGESYRIQSRSYATSDNPTSYLWDGEVDLSGTPADGYKNANIVYATNLLYPDVPGNNGDFTTDLGPFGQPDYTSMTGNREYFRYFKVTGLAQAGGKQLSIELAGDAKVCREDDITNFAAGGKGIKVYLWRSGAGTGGYINGQFTNVLTAGFRSGNNINSDSKYIPVQDYQSIDYSENAISVGGTSVPIGVLKTIDTSTNNYAVNEYVIVRIVTPEDWTGFIDAMALRFGTPGAGTTPYLGDSTGGYAQTQNYGNTRL